MPSYFLICINLWYACSRINSKVIGRLIELTRPVLKLNHCLFVSLTKLLKHCLFNRWGRWRESRKVPSLFADEAHHGSELRQQKTAFELDVCFHWEVKRFFPCLSITPFFVLFNIIRSTVIGHPCFLFLKNLQFYFSSDNVFYEFSSVRWTSNTVWDPYSIWRSSKFISRSIRRSSTTSYTFCQDGSYTSSCIILPNKFIYSLCFIQKLMF